jgi:hypothetical protein
VSTFGGDFASAFAIRPERSERGKRLHFTLGNGSAQVNLESFQGSIELLKRSQQELRQKMDRAQRDRLKALQKWGEWNPMRRVEIRREQRAQHERRHTEEHPAAQAPNDGGDDQP